MELRLATRGEAAGIAEIYGPIVTSTAISFELEPPDEEEMSQRIDDITRTYPWVVCVDGGRVAGYAYGSRIRPRAAYDWSVEVTAYVHHEFRRRGTGQKLCQALFRILRAQGYINAYAGIALPNAASVALHESVGFEPVGVYRKIGYKLGAWHDVGWWQRPLVESPGEPKPLVSIEALQEDPAWAQLLG